MRGLEVRNDSRQRAAGGPRLVVDAGQAGAASGYDDTATATSEPREIGVLAVQGAFAEHIAILSSSASTRCRCACRATSRASAA